MSQDLIRTLNRRRKKLNLKSFRVTAAIILAVLLSLFIFQNSSLARGNALIENYENRIEEISRQNRDLEIDFSQKNSLRDTESLLEELNFEKVTKIDYIRVLETSVAAK